MTIAAVGLALLLAGMSPALIAWARGIETGIYRK